MSDHVLFADAHWQSCYVAFLSAIYERSHSLASLRNYRSILHRFFTDHPHPQNVTRGDVAVFLARNCEKRHNGTPSAATRKFRLCALSSFYEFASGYPDSIRPLFQRPNPTSGMVRGRPARVRRTISEDDLKRLFAVIPQDTAQGLRDRAIYLTYFWTARRREEIARLRWGDIELAEIADEHGLAHNGYLYRYQSKGHSEQDSVAELPQIAYDAIHAYLEASGRLATITADAPLFVAIGPDYGGRARDPLRPLCSNAIADNLKRYVQAAGLDPAISLHWLRHAATQHRHRRGQSIRSLKRLLGHASIATTELYVGLLNGTADDGADLLLASFGKM